MFSKQFKFQWLLALIGAAVLSACGGGGGTDSSGSASTTENDLCGVGFTMPILIYPNIQGYLGVPISKASPFLSKQLPASCASSAIYLASNLPAGLSINALTGVISGTPTATQTSLNAVTVRLLVSKPLQSVAMVTVNIQASAVANCAPSLPKPSYSVITATQNMPVSVFQSGSTSLPSGCVVPFTYSATGLPVGLKINAKTGEISGNASTSGVGTFTVTVSSPNYLSVTSSPVAYVVSVGTPCLATGLLPPTIAYSKTFGVTAATSMMIAQSPTFSYPLPAGCQPVFTATGLPAGAVINSATGVISGLIDPTATAGTMEVTFYLPTYPSTTSGVLTYEVYPVETLPLISVPQPGSTAAEIKPTAEGIWGSGNDLMLIAADGTFFSAGSSPMIGGFYSSITYPTSNTWSLLSGGAAPAASPILIPDNSVTGGSGTFVQKTIFSGSYQIANAGNPVLRALLLNSSL
jgi:hypothetical protein